MNDFETLNRHRVNAFIAFVREYEREAQLWNEFAGGKIELAAEIMDQKARTDFALNAHQKARRKMYDAGFLRRAMGMNSGSASK